MRDHARKGVEFHRYAAKPWRLSEPFEGERFDISLKPRVRQELLLANFRYRKATTNFSGKAVGNFRVTRNCFDTAGAWVCPQRVRTSFALKVATVPPKMLEQRAPFHLTVTVSRIASGGTPRSASSRRSSRISSIASAKFSRASSLVRPCPFAPGISGQ
jgi:hypothetical protein